MNCCAGALKFRSQFAPGRVDDTAGPWVNRFSSPQQYSESRVGAA
jgi:hypothetical protein